MVQKILNRKKVNPTNIVFTGVKQVEEISAQIFKYNSFVCEENSNFKINQFSKFETDNHCNWLNIHGIHDSEVIVSLCRKLEIDNLAIQDLLDVNQRPKFQEFDNYWFFTLKSIIPSKNNAILEQEQLSFILGKNYLVSFQERVADYFSHIRGRLRNNIGLARSRGSDFLLFLMLEAILDNYFTSLNNVEKAIEISLKIDINEDPSPELINIIEGQKNQVYQIKKTILPIKEFILKIEREKFNFIEEKNIKYFYELKDLCLSLIDICDHLEVKLESSTNLFFSVQGHRMNQVMKTLTIVATIFIPLTFIAGIYGMNFSNMPELQWKFGYLGVWIAMLIVFIIMLIYFKKKKWF